MNVSFAIKSIALCALLAGANVSFSHVSLPPGGAAAGSDYEAVLRVGHACQGASATTGITVRLPEGFTFTSAQPRAGWALATTAREVAWKAESPQAALADKAQAEFVVRGRLTDQPGPLWFKVLQACSGEGGVATSVDWAQVPVPGATEKPAFPAARLDVLPAGVAPVDVRDAWVRPAVPGQSGTGGFMKLNAPSGTRLVGVSSPVAGVAQVHEMKMDGDTMRMRALKNGLELPARQTVELKPGGAHLMLMDLKQPITQGATVPMTLRFEDARGVKSSLELKVPVGAPAGEGAPAAAGQAHQH
ncbi:MAG: hypothetical protein JWQ03_1734 [Variovorax sp.]|nr:hypothetical protein [Variovorax sp.]